jgi:hypothetical protein
VTRRLSVWLAGAAVVLTVLALVGCVVATTVAPVKATQHPGFTAGTACDAAGCHTPSSFKPPYQHKEPYLGPCENCHSLDRWKPAVYSHKDTSFDNGMHPLVGCAMCHKEGQPLPTGGCAKCHQSPHGGFKQCVNCHTTNAWGMRKPLPDTHISLLGGHSKLTCFDCHKDEKKPQQPRHCTNCHGTNHGGLTNCQDCHDPSTGWKPKNGWSHDTFFVRIGQHAKLDCTACHKGGRFAGTPKVCVGCHGKQHGGLTNCGACHTPAAAAGFKYTTFKHASTGFPLTGRHTSVGCMGNTGVQCHYNGQFAKVRGGGSHACVACHGAQHGGLTDCASCHTTAGFGAPTFRHTAFPLVGKHGTVGCTGTTAIPCHPGGEFFPKPNKACVSCHGSMSPHGSGTTQCQDCHSPANPAFAPIAPYTNHPIRLTGVHTDTTKCGQCHPSLNFTAPRTACTVSGCHAVFHVGPTDCLRCHFRPTPFQHPPIYFGTVLVPASPHMDLAHGTYPTDCLNCHPGSGTVPDFTVHSCSNASCHTAG